jgi:hypothetical protein
MNLHKAYHGNFGVDMMVYKAPDNNQILINPAVEINLRMTMGIVAHSLAKHVLNPSQSGILSVKYAPHDTYGHNYHVSGKKLSDGTLDLIPFDQNFRITLTTSPTFKLPI